MKGDLDVMYCTVRYQNVRKIVDLAVATDIEPPEELIGTVTQSNRPMKEPWS